MKYELTNEVKEFYGITLHRIKATKSFGSVNAGDLGGFIGSEDNLSQEYDAWVYGNAKVCGNAKVYGDAWVCGNAEVCGNAWVYGDAEVCGNAKVYGNAEVCGNAWVYGDAEVCGNAKVCGDADYIVFKNWWSSGRYFTWTRTNNKWRVGCFYGSGEELIKKAYADSERSGREYERVVRYVEQILSENVVQ